MGRFAVEGRRLVRVLAVRQVAVLAQNDRKLLRKALPADVGEVGGDFPVVRGHGCEGLGRKVLSGLG